MNKVPISSINNRYNITWSSIKLIWGSLGLWFMVFNATVINISVISCTPYYTDLTSSIPSKGYSSWSCDSWIYNYLCNQCISPIKLWVRILLRRCVLDTTFCDEVCQWLVAGRWFSSGTPVSSINKTYRHDITEILMTVALNTITLTLIQTLVCLSASFQSLE
jgi:hypothetical protein